MNDKQSNNKFRNIKFAGEVIAIVIALVSLLVGVGQYIAMNKWDKAKFAAENLKRRSSDQIIEMAESILDWKNSTYYLPDRMKDPLLKKEQTFEHSWELLEQAFVPEKIKKDYSGEEGLYTKIFDRYFDFIEEINQHIENDLYSLKDVDVVCYYAKKIESPKYAKNKKLFMTYLKENEFSGVIKFIDKCNLDNLESTQ